MKTNYMTLTPDDWVLVSERTATDFSMIQVVSLSGPVYWRLEDTADPPGPDDVGGFVANPRSFFSDHAVDALKDKDIGLYARGSGQICVFKEVDPSA